MMRAGSKLFPLQRLKHENNGHVITRVLAFLNLEISLLEHVILLNSYAQLVRYFKDVLVRQQVPNRDVHFWIVLVLLQDVHNYISNFQRSDHVLDILLLVQKTVWDNLLLLCDNAYYLRSRLN